MMEFFQTYTQFYRDHRWVFRDNHHGVGEVRVGVADVSASLLVGRGHRRAVHLVNPHYDRGIIPRTGFTVEVDVPRCPRRIAMISPDFEGWKVPPSSRRHGRLTVTVDRLDYYGILLLGR